MRNKILLGFVCCLGFIGLMSATIKNMGSGVSTTRYQFGSGPFYSSSDSLTNAVTDTFDAAIVGVKSSTTWQFNFVKISGTAGGTVVIQASADQGANWVTLTTLNIENRSSQSLAYSITGNPYTNYRAIVNDTGTQVSAVRAWLLVR